MTERIDPIPFAPQHPWDRNLYLILLGLGWVGILMGFGGSIANHVSHNRPPYPAIVHVHAIVFTGWLVLFTLQLFLIRFKRISVHRRLGYAMAAIAVLMLILGPATALTVKYAAMNKPNADPGFLSVQFTDLLAFAGLTGAGIFWRNHPAAHKRLMLLGTLYITDAGFARWLGGGVVRLLGESPAGLWAALYLAPNVLFLILGAYDLGTRRRLHPAYVGGLLWILANQVTAVTLYLSPAWTECAKRIIASWP